MDALGIGVLGAANIARKVVIPSILRADGVRLLLIGSESRRAADFVAEAQLDGVRVCRYEELLVDPEVDAVYIPLPNHLHAEWTFARRSTPASTCCARSRSRSPRPRRKRHVVAARECGVSDGGVHGPLHPQWKLLRASWRAAHRRSAHRALVLHVPDFNRDPQNVRRRPELGGGAIYDVGYYGVNARGSLFGREPVAVTARQHVGPEGVDEEFQGVLDFGSGRSALVASSFCQPYRHEVELLGTEGRILVPQAFVNRSDPLWFEVEDATGAREHVDTPGDDEYRLEVEDFAACVRAGRQPEIASHADTLANMRAIDALYELARTGRAIEL